MNRDKLIEKVAETIYGYDIGNGDFDDFEKLARRVVKMVERQLTPHALDDAKVCGLDGGEHDWKGNTCMKCRGHRQ